ncbi:restriction endonuclease subunit S [Vibrio sp. OCN044]|uniref:Restriction endonuclease subunit S n=1 Tax=Vibrio tetraodonis subsp. pristinus TaxID=2695891 RepID=A0A6L8M1F4_9VIBR|nr:restriction endonuclease subunit S [Vibrio tetraodonis]MYM61703.1 restriction endonuclease subunit S [Vibrio tetraodonis subsp. pristinus]
MVPNGWIQVTLGDLVQKSAFGPRFTSELYSKDGAIGTIRTTDLYNDGEINYATIPYADLDVSEYEEHVLNEGDLLITRSGTCGIPCIFTEQEKPIIAGAFLIRFQLKERVYSKFLHEVLKSAPVQSSIKRMAAGGVQKNLTGTSLKKLHLSLPPLPEQRKIANILSTWDKAITTTEKLIKTSKQQKKALMQQLLTGKKRLVNPETGKAFQGEWEDKYLNDFSKVIVSPVDKKTVEGEIPVELCNYTDVYYNTNITKKLDFMRATAKQSEIDKFTLEVDDVIITKDSETPGDIAVPALVSEDLDGVVCGYHLAIVRTNKQQADGAFINCLFSMPKTRYYFFTLATGATRFGLSIGGINKAHFCLPPLEEQQKIASVLTAADKEIEVLEAKLAHFKQEKKALMQQLLTGKRRVSLSS